jgi:hypothetical protein
MIKAKNLLRSLAGIVLGSWIAAFVVCLPLSLFDRPEPDSRTPFDPDVLDYYGYPDWWALLAHEAISYAQFATFCTVIALVFGFATHAVLFHFKKVSLGYYLLAAIFAATCFAIIGFTLIGRVGSAPFAVFGLITLMVSVFIACVTATITWLIRRPDKDAPA